MTPPLDTQNLGNTTLPPAGPAPMKRTSGGCGGCGCGCFSGCIILILLIAGSLFGVYYFGIRNGAYIEHLDGVVEWAYKNAARPKILEMMGPSMTPEEREQFLQMTDGAVDKYLALPPEEKKEVLSEAITAYGYLATGEVLPPEKIPHLKKFVDDIQKNLQLPPKHNWQAPKPIHPSAPSEPQDSPRLLN